MRLLLFVDSAELSLQEGSIRQLLKLRAVLPEEVQHGFSAPT